jgi:hypothetical protein
MAVQEPEGPRSFTLGHPHRKAAKIAKKLFFYLAVRGRQIKRLVLLKTNNLNHLPIFFLEVF